MPKTKREKETSITFRIRATHKRALSLVAADQGLTASDLLQDAVEKIIRTYKNGFFYDYVARENVHNGSEGSR